MVEDSDQREWFSIIVPCAGTGRDLPPRISTWAAPRTGTAPGHPNGHSRQCAEASPAQEAAGDQRRTEAHHPSWKGSGFPGRHGPGWPFTISVNSSSAAVRPRWMLEISIRPQGHGLRLGRATVAARRRRGRAPNSSDEPPSHFGGGRRANHYCRCSAPDSGSAPISLNPERI